MKTTLTILVTLLLSLIPTFAEDKKLPKYTPDKSHVIKAIKDADKIIVKEHANELDYESREQRPATLPVYKTATLAPVHAQLLLEALTNLKGMGISPTTCAFDPHHTMEFYKDGKLINSLLLCYRCDGIRFSDSHRVGAKDIVAVMAPGLKEAGFTTSRDWRKLAAAHLEKTKE